MTMLKYEVAALLANHYNHQWGVLWERLGRPALEDLQVFGKEPGWSDANAVAALHRVIAPTCGPCGGICAPDVDEEGWIHHVTTSRGLHWHVAPDGEQVVLEVERPIAGVVGTHVGNLVLRAVVSIPYGGEIGVVFEELSKDYRVRHVGKIIEPLGVLIQGHKMPFGSLRRSIEQVLYAREPLEKHASAQEES